MSPLRLRSLRAKLILAIGLPLLLSHGVLLTVEYQIGRKEAIAGMENYLRELTRHQAARIDGEFSVIAQAARSSAWFLDDISPGDSEALARVLRGNLAQSPLVYGSAIAFDPALQRASPYLYRAAAGKSLRQIDIGRDAYDYTTWDWYQKPRETRSSLWTEPYFDKGAGNTLMVTYSVPLLRQGTFRGVVTVDVSLENLRADMARLRVKDGFVAIVSRRGTYLSHPQAKRVMQDSVFSVAARLNLPELAAAGREMVAGKSGVVRLRDPEDGVGMNWLVFAPVPSTGWSLLAVVDEELVLAEVYQRLHRQLAVSLAGMALVLLILLLVTVRFTRPLIRLRETAKQVAQGDLTARAVDAGSQDEVGQFAAVFNHMLDELGEATAARIRETAAREAVESELKVALEIQRSLLPHVFPPFPHHPEFDLYALCEPAKAVSGDFYDFFLLDSTTLALVIADVCGKGVPAAMFMAVARTTLRNFSQPERSPGEILEAVNEALRAENENNMFVTLFYAHYDLSSGRLRYAGAGHPPPCLIRVGGGVTALASEGTVLGVFKEARYAVRETQLQTGDVLVLYTDGVTEAGDATGMLYGEARLEALLKRVAGQTAEAICQAVVGDVEAYRHGERQDDVTLLVLRCNS
ncbi:MAG: SpoIIE family protein phosphatase [Sulfuricellaceae bacterium]